MKRIKFFQPVKLSIYPSRTKSEWKLEKPQKSEIELICEYLPGCKIQGFSSDRCYMTHVGCDIYRMIMRYGEDWRQLGIG